jgi:acetyltransferase-like isoleucine patch superfamily enzyme
VTVGKDCRIYIQQFGTEPFLISIGDRVTITAGVKIITHDGSTALVRDEGGRRYLYYARVEIGDDVFVGVDSIILPGVKIGSKVVVGAGSVVTRDIPDNCVVVGSPARVVGTFEAFRSRVVANYVKDSELDGISDYRQRVSRVISLVRERK